MKEPLTNWEQGMVFCLFGGILIPLLLLCAFGLYKAITTGSANMIVIVGIASFAVISVVIGVVLCVRGDR